MNRYVIRLAALPQPENGFGVRRRCLAKIERVPTDGEPVKVGRAIGKGFTPASAERHATERARALIGRDQQKRTGALNDRLTSTRQG